MAGVNGSNILRFPWRGRYAELAELDRNTDPWASYMVALANDNRLNEIDIRVVLALLSVCAHKHEMELSIENISEFSGGLDQDDVKAALYDLSQMGWITINQGREDHARLFVQIP